MLEWLVDHPTWIYVTLGVVALGLLVALWTTRKRKYAVGIAVAAGLALLVWLITYLVPTDRKRIVAAVEDMGAGVKAQSPDRIAKYNQLLRIEEDLGDAARYGAELWPAAWSSRKSGAT